MESSTSSCVTSSVAGCNEVFRQVDNGVPENCMVVLPECPNSPDTLEDPIKREYTCSTNAASWANTKCVDNKPETLRTKISSLENNCSPRDPSEESTSPVSDKRTGFETSQNHKLPVFMTQINHFQSSIPKNPQQAVDLNGRAAHSMPSLGSNESRLTPKMLNCAKVTPARSVSNGDFLSVMRSLAEKQMASSSKTQTHYPSSPQVLRPPVPPSKYQNEDLGRISPPDDLMTSSNPVNGTSSHIQLWQFLLELLGDPSKAHIISWINSSGEFKLHNSEEVARLWGLRKNKTGMNYDKLSRALRYYYHKGLIKKVLGQKFVYKFIAVPSDANQSSNAFSPSSEPNSPDAVSPNPCSPPVTTARTPKTPIFPNGTPPSSPVVMVCKRPPALVSAKDEPLDLSADTSACPNSTPSEVSRSSLTLNGVPGAKKMFFNIPNSACSTAQSPHHPTLSSPRQSKTPTEDKPCPRANSPILESTPHSSSIPVSTMAAIPAAAASSLYPWFAAAATRDPTMLSSAVCSPVAFPGFPLFYAAPIAMAATGNAHGSLGSCCQQMRATSTSMTNTVSVKNEWTQTEPLEPGAVSDSGKCCECNCRCNQSSPLVSAASSLPSSSFPSSFISTSAPPVSKEGQISTLEDSESVVERSS